ncbi:Stomatin-like protein 2 mitochondrial [Babesia microti strain RI]|uniref:Stomatin-like protein 2 mitochondrial n=1 Tax=Babesia microti (strain RI) TaxID=1133968 RepID=A0A1R4AB76_BABMR|nr:Stomatin-like protein 2 mitochondrial [Babesia microti strain RI]SJK86184.1 Stomatin-like protein 2 mitochondrial [Babesia microti strain RI]|eukprot:XP_021338375.1 Stomatin-like protein 2 mitochondrial [Babesia microti strain RI]
MTLAPFFVLNLKSINVKLHSQYRNCINYANRVQQCHFSTRGEHIQYPKRHVGVTVVPQQTVFIIERFGRYKKTISAGLHFLIPFIDKIAYIHSLKEEAIVIPNQTAITKDNVIIQIDGILYIKCVNPYDASYGVEDPVFSVMQLAQTTMRSELGKLSLDSTFLERESLNKLIVEAINTASKSWGITCMRYEIRDITPPKNIVTAMERQAEAERIKRAEILKSEGNRESEINLAQGRREIDILRAQGEAIATKERAKATAEAIHTLAEALKSSNSSNAVALRVAEQYISAFNNLAKHSTTVLLPSKVDDAAGMVAQALGIYNAAFRNDKIQEIVTNENKPPK